MPMFELDAGRAALVQPMQPAAGTFPETSTVVADHLGSLLGEQLFPVATRQQGADAPHLLAVDAAGQPVVVEVVEMLDADALARALRFAGAAARLSSADLARGYPGGPERFATELVAFRENVPVAAAHAASRYAGARLLLVCSEVAENVVDAVEFLRRPGGQVEVLQVGVLRGADGRRYVDVSPLVAKVHKRRPVEPSELHVVRQSEHHQSERAVTHEAPRTHHASASAPAETEPTPERVSIGPVRVAGAMAPTGTFPSVLPVPVSASPVRTRGPRPDPTLAALAGELASATTLVWSRQRRGQRLVAMLRVDGLIQLPDGGVYAEPDEAAAAAAGSDAPIDGWKVWRVGDRGPTLAEARSA